MSNRRRRRPSPRRSAQDIPLNITKEQLVEAIALGMEKVEARRQVAEAEEKAKAYEKWCAQIKRPKNYDSLKGWKRELADLRTFLAIIGMSFRQRKVEEGPSILHNLIAVMLSLLFEVIRCFFVLLAMVCVFYQPVAYLLGKRATLNPVGALAWAILGFVILGFSAIFKLISDEILGIKDTALLIALMSLFLSLTSILISIVT